MRPEVAGFIIRPRAILIFPLCFKLRIQLELKRRPVWESTTPSHTSLVSRGTSHHSTGSPSVLVFPPKHARPTAIKRTTSLSAKSTYRLKPSAETHARPPLHGGGEYSSSTVTRPRESGSQHGAPVLCGDHLLRVQPPQDLVAPNPHLFAWGPRTLRERWSAR